MSKENKNANLNRAGKVKNDEFYTQLPDIENELRHYKEHFKGKTVFCNCDDPYESNFFKYFALNFNALGLKKLICTCYATSPIIYTQLLFDGNELPLGIAKEGRKPYKIEISEVKDLNGDGAIDLTDVELLLKSVNGKPELLKGDGDFRSEECVDILKSADIVVTNPPFSLFREYVGQLVEYKKKFIIIGNMNALHYKEIFPLVQNNDLWLGVNSVKEFIQPDGTTKKFGNILWYTNLDIKKRHENVILYKKYNPEEYPKYENFDAIEVKSVADIPCDYFGNMGVPDTFLDLYNPDEFDIIGLAESSLGVKIGISANLSEEQLKAFKAENPSFRRGNPIYRDKNGKLKKPFSRIIIRRKQGL